MWYMLGQTLTFGIRTYDSDGVLADIETGPSCTLTRPDGQVVAGTVVQDATGTYRAVASASMGGRWSAVWTGSGANSGGLPYPDFADVIETPRFLISLADARAGLSVPSALRVDDDELLLLISAATEIIEDLVGTVLPATATEVHDGEGQYGIPLADIPSAVATVTLDGSTLSSTDWCIDTAGVLWRGNTPWQSRWPWGARNIEVTYTVGGTSVPSHVLMAARELVKWLFTRQQVPRPAPGAPSSGVQWTPNGFAVPHAVVELLAPSAGHKRPGFA